MPDAIARPADTNADGGAPPSADDVAKLFADEFGAELLAEHNHDEPS